MSDIGVSNFADVVSQVTGLITETTGFTTAAAAATATAAAVTPPGVDADSVEAVVQHTATVAEFVSMMGLGIAQLGERAAETTLNNSTFQIIPELGAAAVAMV